MFHDIICIHVFYFTGDANILFKFCTISVVVGLSSYGVLKTSSDLLLPNMTDVSVKFMVSFYKYILPQP